MSGDVSALALSKRHRRLAAAIVERRSVLLKVSRYSVMAGRNGGPVDTDACRLHPEDPFLPEVDIG
jgi:hypothetical protein